MNTNHHGTAGVALDSTAQSCFLSCLRTGLRSYKEARSAFERTREGLEVMGHRQVAQQARGEKGEDLTSIFEEFEKRKFIMEHELAALLWLLENEPSLA